MYCEHCGRKLQDGDKYCSVCGAEVKISQQDIKVSDIKNESKSDSKKHITIGFNPPKYIWGIIIVVIIVGIAGIGIAKQFSTKASDSQQSSVEEESGLAESNGSNTSANDNADTSSGNHTDYRAYSIDDYSTGNSLTYYDTSASLYRGNEIEDTADINGNTDHMRTIFRKDILKEIGTTDQYDINKSILRFIEKYFPQDVFAASFEYDDCVDLEYIELENTYAYYKVTVNNPEELRSQFAGWGKGDEVYMIATGAMGTNGSGEWCIKFSYFIRNFSKDNVTNESSTIDEEVTYADWGNPYCTENTISTEIYTLTVPDGWINHCTYDISENWRDISFYIPNGYEGTYDSFLFSIEVVYDESYLRNLLELHKRYLGAVYSSNGIEGYLLVQFPGDAQYTEQSEETYNYYAAGIDSIIDSLIMNEGYTLQ